MLVKERLEGGSWIAPWLRYQHLARYEWAADLCGGARVLDAACANGYGSASILHSGAALVAGLDIDLGTLAEGAMAGHGRGPSLLAGDATALPFRPAAFDVFLSFETVEHVADDVAYLREARRVLRPGGVFVCSTPNRAMTNPGTSIHQPPFNRFHRREYDFSELQALLSQAFETIEWFGQSFFGRRYGAALCFIGSRFPMAAVRLHQVRKVAGAAFDRPVRHVPVPLHQSAEPEVFIAVCR